MIEGFGTNETALISADGAEDFHGILKPGETQTVCFTPLSGLLTQDKFMPIRYCPIQLEFELVGNASEAVQGAISSIGGSGSFLIDNVQVKCDLVQLDNSLGNGYSSHSLSGKSQPINFSTFTCASQVITNIETIINVQRSFTRLKSVFISLYKD